MAKKPTTKKAAKKSAKKAAPKKAAKKQTSKKSNAISSQQEALIAKHIDGKHLNGLAHSVSGELTEMKTHEVLTAIEQMASRKSYNDEVMQELIKVSE